MEVCLISPPTITEYADAGIAESETVRIGAEYAPLGILSLAAILERRGVPVRIIDLNATYYDFLRGAKQRRAGFCAYAAQRLARMPCNLFGFGTICSTYPLTIRLARMVKQAHPSASVVLGGPQASVVDAATLDAFPFVDYIVRGEAEETFPALLEAISRGATRPTGLRELLGVTFRDGSGVVRNSAAPVILDLDHLPMPAYHLYAAMEGCRHVPLEVGRGCPFACTFCSTNNFFRRRFRLKSAAKVLEQMQHLHATYGVDSFDLIHDMFTVDRKRVAAFCETMIGSGEHFHWVCSARTDCIDDDLIRLMARAGCRGIFFGVETGSPRLQRIIAKNLDLVEAKRRIECANAEKIPATVSLITGFPEETIDDLRQTVGLLMDSLRSEYAELQLHLLAPLAGTAMHLRFRDELRLDGIYSDMSHQGWRQQEDDIALIERFRDIFPNFYFLPTPHLDRPYIDELRLFFMNGTARFRWLIVALHQQTGDILKVFGEWREWRLARRIPGPQDVIGQYYASAAFRLDFLDFVLRSEYAAQGIGGATAVKALAKLELSIERAGRCEDNDGTEPEEVGREGARVLSARLVPRPVNAISVIELDWDYAAVVGALKRGEQPDSGAFGRASSVALRIHAGRSEVLQLPPILAYVLKSCNGERTVLSIVQTFQASGMDIPGVPKQQVCLYALRELSKQGLVSIGPRARRRGKRINAPA